MKKKHKKYRVMLSPSIISSILSQAKTAYATLANQESLDIITALAPYEAKIATGSIVEAYTAAGAIHTPKTDIQKESDQLASLGADTGAEQQAVLDPDAENFLSKDAYWAACYAIYILHPASSLSVETIDAAKEHMYLNDLLSDSEREAMDAATAIEIQKLI